MKKLVFVSIVFFGFNVLLDNVWSADVNHKSSQGTQSLLDKSNKKQTKKKKAKTNKKVSNKVSNYQAQKTKETKATVKTEINLDNNELYILKLFVDSVLERDIRAIISNINILYRNLSFRKSEQEKEGEITIKETLDILKQTSSCLEELLRIRSSLYVELFNKVEPKSKLPETSDLKYIKKNLNFIDKVKLNEIIAKAEQRSVSPRVIRNLKAFSERKEQAEYFIDEMNLKFTKSIISRVEGLPSLDNLSDMDTVSNNNLLKLREQVASGKVFDNDIDNKLWEEVERELSVGDLK